MLSELRNKANICKDSFFFVGLVLLTITSFFSPNYISGIKKYIGFLIILMFVIKIFMSEYTKREILVSVLLGIVLLISTYFSDREALMLSFFALLASKDITLKSIFKVIFVSGLISMGLSIVIYFSVEGFSQALLEKRQFFGVELLVSKNSLGYSHANMLYLLMFVLVSLYTYVRFNVLTIIDYMGILLVSLLFFWITFSRTGIIVSLVSILILVLLKKIPSNNFLYRYIAYIPLFILFLSFILPFLYTLYPDGIMHILNRTLSDRLYYSAEFLRVAEQSFFGTNVHGIVGGETGFPLRADNSFVLILRAYGYINFAILCLLTFKISKQTFKNEEWYIIIIMYLYCFTEGFFVIAVQNIALFVLSKKYFDYSVVRNKMLLVMLWRKQIE